MAQSSWPTVAGGHSITDAQWEMMAPGFATDGIVGSIADTPVIYADSTGLQVKLRASKYGIVRGHGWTSGTADIVLPLTTNSSGSTRTDLAVLRFDRGAQSVTMVIKPGTPGAGAPALQRDAVTLGSGLYEVAVAQVAVVSGATIISAASVTIVHPFVSGPQIVVPDLTTLGLLTLPPYGTLAVAGNQAYVYTSSGWLRADWNSGWGLIGGHEYTSSGVITASGIPAGAEYVMNLDSNLITFVAGRRYRATARFKFVVNTTNAYPTFHIRDSSTTGVIRASVITPPLLAGIGYPATLIGQWSETAGGSRYLVACTSVSAGLISAYRDVTDERIGLFVEDLGPASLIPSPT